MRCPFSAWIRITARYLRNNNVTAFTNRCNSLLPMQLINEMGSCFRREPLLKMLTKFLSSIFCHPKLKKRCSTFSVGPYGHTTSPYCLIWGWSLVLLLLYVCEHYSAKIWALLGQSMTLAISQHTGDYIPNLVLTLLEIVFNKTHPSILLHIKDAATWKVLILLLQETKP